MSIQTYGNSSLAFGFSGFCPATFAPEIFQLALPLYESRESWRSRVEDEVQNYQTAFCSMMTLSNPEIASLVDGKISMLAAEKTNWLTGTLGYVTSTRCMARQWKLCSAGILGTAATHLFSDSLSTLMGSFYSRESVVNDLCTSAAAREVKPRIQEIFADRMVNNYKVWSGLQEKPTEESSTDQWKTYLDAGFEHLTTQLDQMDMDCKKIVENHGKFLLVDEERIMPWSLGGLDFGLDFDHYFDYYVNSYCVSIFASIPMRKARHEIRQMG